MATNFVVSLTDLVNYPGKSIKVLTVNEAIRKRPSMYLSEKKDPHFYVYILLEMAVGIFYSLEVKNIKLDLVLIENSIRIRGILPNSVPLEESSNLRANLEKFFVPGGRSEGDLIILNALTTYLNLTFYQDGSITTLNYSRGDIISISSKENVEDTGIKHLTLEFQPDEVVFDNDLRGWNYSLMNSDLVAKCIKNKFPSMQYEIEECIRLKNVKNQI